MKHLLSVTDTQDNILDILELADKLKKDPWGYQTLKNNVLAMIFEKSSTRTRISLKWACCSWVVMPSTYLNQNSSWDVENP